MQGVNNGEKPLSETMTELRLFEERRISDLRERSTAASASFGHCLRSSRAVADYQLASLDQSVIKKGTCFILCWRSTLLPLYVCLRFNNWLGGTLTRLIFEKIDQLKDELREGQANLAQALSAKTRNDVRFAAMTKDLATKRARCEQIKKAICDQRNKVDECTTIISKSLQAGEAHEEKIHQAQSEKGNLDSSITWYQKALGLRVVHGEGVKFIFNKIDSTNPDKEYSFTVRLDNDKYNLLHCDPSVEGIDDLLKEVNKTKDFFRFVRVMREKFASSSFSVKSLSITQTSVSGGSSLFTESSPVESSSVTPSVEKKGAKSKKGLKTPPSSAVRRSARLRN